MTATLCSFNLMFSMEKRASPEISSAESHQFIENWIQVQDSLKRRLVTEDDFTWKLPKPTSTATVRGRIEEGDDKHVLKYVGGVDVSFSKDDPSVACGTIVVLDLGTLEVVYDDYSVVRLQTPYVPGFLALREAPVLLKLLEKMKNSAHPFYPQLLMVDGNGLLHPRGFGLACHLGVLANIPTIGIGKTLHHVDGLTQSGVRELLEAKGNLTEDFIALTGYSGRTLGVAMRSTESSLKPIFVSIGHRVSLDTAIIIIKMTCNYRVPEPVRQADIRSRQYLQKHQWR
ncbi:hypothetical protein AAG906_002732 [Vitis piasezkii]|uniref:Endonuclease V n=1 Tax=Vitis vinifera TaxID=29760 RepID=A0ABY9BQ14_VITVI|nr:uncharacterized protein LOC100249201 isoform X1 [Vitis vinifera]WJZ85038.1 hypothetical protein VitviT2T_004605 [Vitis vinifera]|eukprot:XP_002281010.1 PREDICTED: endonuclease V isoform X1 [Vitis vinifera]